MLRERTTMLRYTYSACLVLYACVIVIFSFWWYFSYYSHKFFFILGEIRYWRCCWM